MPNAPLPVRDSKNAKDAADRRRGPDRPSISPAAISLPKGGGAIRGIGEKFAANAVTGTGSLSVPISTSPGRSDFGLQLSQAYDSGAGNGPFCFGWSLSLPSITRKTDKGLPQYWDAEASDAFILSSAEDLVPGEIFPPRPVNDTTYCIQRYRKNITVVDLLGNGTACPVWSSPLPGM